MLLTAVSGCFGAEERLERSSGWKSETKTSGLSYVFPAESP